MFGLRERDSGINQDRLMADLDDAVVRRNLTAAQGDAEGARSGHWSCHDEAVACAR
jgi:hypothetical protein